MGVLLDEDYGYELPSDNWRGGYDTWKSTEPPDDDVVYYDSWLELEARAAEVRAWVAEHKAKEQELVGQEK